MNKEDFIHKIKGLIVELNWHTVDSMGLFEDLTEIINKWNFPEKTE